MKNREEGRTKELDLLKGKPKRLYHKYLLPSFASALMISIYSFVDTIAVGQYAGPPGTAAIAVVTPLYGIFTFLAILCGVGGAVLLGKSRGEGNFEKGNAYFTAEAKEILRREMLTSLRP